MAKKNHKFIESLAPGRKKYELTDETKEVDGHVLHRIRATIDIKDLEGSIRIKKGTLGGWVEKESNLSQSGACWVYQEGMVYGEAVVSMAGQVSGEARVYGEARVFNEARITSQSKIYDRATICGKSGVLEKAKIHGNATVNDALVSGHAEIYGNARITSGAEVRHDAKIYENAVIEGSVKIVDRVKIHGDAYIECYADADGWSVPSECTMWICGDTEVAGKAVITAQ